MWAGDCRNDIWRDAKERQKQCCDMGSVSADIMKWIKFIRLAGQKRALISGRNYRFTCACAKNTAAEKDCR
jgi:hypothetical protein